MKTSLNILLFLISFVGVQAQSIPSDKLMWNFSHYNFEYSTDKLDDTLYVIQFFPKKNNWKVYFDKQKIDVATLYNYDTVKNTINIKHFNRQGKLIKELQLSYFNSEKLNPGFPKIENLISLKSYIDDSLICEIKGFKSSIQIDYKNHRTNEYFFQNVYYQQGEHTDEEIGKTKYVYYQNGHLKQICSSIVYEYIDDEVTYAKLCPNCINFDINGCVINQK